MFGKNFQRKYALTDQGVKNTKKGAFWTVIVNLVVMGGMGILYLLMYGLMGTLTDGAPLPGPALFLGLVIAFVILSFVTHLQQYHATYGLVYNEVKSTRLSLAERLRKLPLGYFGKRALAHRTARGTTPSSGIMPPPRPRPSPCQRTCGAVKVSPSPGRRRWTRTATP